MTVPTTASSLPVHPPAVAPFIPIASPEIGEEEVRNVMECLRSSWISSRGEFIDRFEEAFAHYCDARHAIACNTGTAALHAALWAAGVRSGDEVIVPSLTYIATANAVRYCGAEPVFADSDPETWNIDPTDVERRITPRTRAIVPVHLFGVPADLGSLTALASAHGVAVIEDAAEAHGAMYDGRPVGAQGLVGIFSFYGNKIITTGEGGMVVTDDDGVAARCRLFKGQGQAPNQTYVFPVVGQNYRMTNIEAAIGLAQL
jgi:perosamine synthetase